MKTTKTKPAAKPQPKMSKHGFMVYPVYDRNGQLVWVSIPGREEA